jgi:S1-C subfamily serine protease
VTVRRCRRGLGLAAALVAAGTVAGGCVEAPPPVTQAAVVTTTTYTPVTLPSPLNDAARRQVVRIRTRTCDSVGVGSGFLVDPTTVVTNRHVVAAAKTIDVETWDGRSLKVASAGEAGDVDLAVIHLAEPYQVSELAGADPTAGDDVRAVGYPEGDEITATAGRVIGYTDGEEGETTGQTLQVSTVIHPGNSGGPLLDGHDHVVGVVFAIDVRSAAGLAIPLSQLQTALATPSSFRPVVACEPTTE